jgi:hypothetical protein
MDVLNGFLNISSMVPIDNDFLILLPNSVPEK